MPASAPRSMPRTRESLVGTLPRRSHTRRSGRAASTWAARLSDPVPTSAPSALGTGERLDAVVLALAGLRRIGLDAHATDVLDPTVMMPAPSQGALAIETPDEEDPLLRVLLGTLHHRPTALAASAERAVLSALGAGCAAPVGAFARVDEASSALLLDARVMSVDGRERVEASGALPLTDSVGRGDAAHLGEDVARQLLARGAAEVTDLGATKAPRQSS